jgi:hypothetical protein
MRKHSPGPWRWEAAGEGPDHWLMKNCWVGGDALDQCVLVAEGGKWPPNDADARLIAAAPELLAALRQWVERAEALGGPFYEDHRALIRRIEGDR